MKAETLNIEGVMLFTLSPAADSRGHFTKLFHETIYKKANAYFEMKEQYLSISHKHVIRGMHFQVPPYDCDKAVTILNGSILDVVLDLRKNSPTFKQWIVVPINAEQPKMLFIPNGCAHGFLSLKDQTCMLYNVSQVYSPSCDTGIRWNSFGYDWPVNAPIVSERDRNLCLLEEFISPF